jgi:outer membrane translocation and assembly module TamA
MDRVNRRANIRYAIEPGPACRFGSVQVTGQEALSTVMIVDVAKIQAGDPYRSSVLRDAERAIYALGTFSSVRVEPQLDREGAVINILITVSPARLSSLRLGVGVMSGVLTAGVSDEVVSVPEWDVHLRAAY